MKREKLYLSTIDERAHALAGAFGLGLEIAEYCTAWNMDDRFPQTDAALQEKLTGIGKRILHGPFNELFPCAIDPMARALAAQRYRQAIAIGKHYEAEKLVIHGGYHPWIYYPVWYTEQSVLFWKEFLQEDPGIVILLENVLEEQPDMLLDIVRAVDHPNLRLCLDVGHANAYSKASAMDWLEACSPWISHFHLHNNDGSWDNHCPLDHGTIPMKQLLNRSETLCTEATYTLELTDGEASVLWLLEE